MKPSISPRARAVPRLRTLIRLRCPHCGKGSVLSGHFAVRERCAECGLRFRRGDPAYFSGAVTINYLLSTASVLVGFLMTLWLSWPTVPWTAITYGAPIVAVVVILLLHPVSKVILLTVDVAFRPVTPDELS
jgi:uncharacterized protein (DUF983 family)